MGMARTMGIEEELQVVDAETFKLAFRAPELLSRLPDVGYSAELQRSTVETNTPVPPATWDWRWPPPAPHHCPAPPTSN
jgi:gamma-glutamyl:cysteine ligase YbdK (ATP-grasp superfamily)